MIKKIFLLTTLAGCMLAGCNDFDCCMPTAINVEPNPVTLGPAARSAETVYLVSTLTWAVIDKPYWLTVSPDEGYAGYTPVTISADANNTGQERSGVVTFMAANGDKSKLNVTQMPVVGVTSITVTPATKSVVVGGAITLTANVLPANATEKGVTWSSSDPSIATVDPAGVVTGVTLGSVTITATAKDGSGKTGTATVTVNDPYTDEGVEISGIIWATRNVDMPGTFATNPEDAGMFYQWNRNIPWPSTGTITGWDDTTPSGTGYYSVNSPCPTGWRVPNSSELSRLGSGVWGSFNGIPGTTFGTGANTLFLPAAGSRWYEDGHLHEVGITGIIWAFEQENDILACCAWFMSDGRHSGYSRKWSAHSVRCIKI